MRDKKKKLRYLYLVLFADDFAGAAVPCRTPVLRRDDFLETLQLANVFQPFIDELPGTWPV
jgi:hypothetical protein